MNRIAAFILIGSVGLAIAGCALGPDPQRPQTAAEGRDRYANARASSTDPVDLGQWWEDFADPTTSELVGQALKNNTDLRAAAARVLQARGQLGVATGERLPGVGAGYTADRTQSVFFGLGTPISSINNTYDLNFNVSWQVDLFGKLKRNQQAAWADLLASEQSGRAVLHSVIAEVVRARAQIATLQRQLASQRANTQSWKQTTGVIERRYEKGLLQSSLEVRLARENLAASRSAEPEIENQIKQAEHRLDVLLGRAPGTGKPLPDTLAALPNLDPVPLGLPIALLDRRPDLRASELRQAAETYRIGVAEAELYPDLTLSASGGWRSNDIDTLIDPKTEVFNLAAQLAWKIWAGGALRANIDIAEARAEEVAADYTGLVLNAMREVEDALVREETARRAYTELQARLTEARSAERLALARYQRGVTSLVTLLETQRRRRTAEIEVIRTQGVLWETRINLYLALGGDWNAVENASEPTDTASIDHEE